MFEKLSKLLFEDEEIDDEEYDDEEYDDEEDDVDEEPVKTKSKRKGGLFGKGKGGLLHIDDDDEDDDDDDFIQRAPSRPTTHVQASSTKPANEPQPVAKTYLKSEPIAAAKSVSSEPVESEQTVRLAKINMTSTDINETIKPTNKQSFGLDVNEITYTEEQPKARVVEPSVKPTVNREVRESRPTHPYQAKSMSVEKGNEFGGRVIEAKPAKKVVEPVTTNYMFQPVISPMFGINDREKSRFEKASEQVQATLEHQAEIHRSASEPVETTKEFGQVLSPMYGTERMPLTSAGANVETMDGSISQPLESMAATDPTTVSEAAPSAVPYQSLDDLIKEGRSTASSANLEATKAFRFEDLLKDDETESDKTVESVYAGKDLFSSVDEDHE